LVATPLFHTMFTFLGVKPKISYPLVSLEVRNFLVALLQIERERERERERGPKASHLFRKIFLYSFAVLTIEQHLSQIYRENSTLLHKKSIVPDKENKKFLVITFSSYVHPRGYKI
jgi:hypothetical protein